MTLWPHLRSRHVAIGAGFAVCLLGLTLGLAVLDRPAGAQAAGPEAPKFEVDPFWPKPLPNHWLLGSTVGVWADADDHIWIVHRPASLTKFELNLELKNGECCAAAPPDKRITISADWKEYRIPFDCFGDGLVFDGYYTNILFSAFGTNSTFAIDQVGYY